MTYFSVVKAKYPATKALQHPDAVPRATAPPYPFAAFLHGEPNEDVKKKAEKKKVGCVSGAFVACSTHSLVVWCRVRRRRRRTVRMRTATKTARKW
jgi:hypothetical protein